jgi:flagellar basal body P-ring protein FlgI
MDAEEENINEIIQNSESSKTEIVQKLNEIHDTMKEMLSILKVLETKW